LFVFDRLESGGDILTIIGSLIIKENTKDIFKTQETTAELGERKREALKSTKRKKKEKEKEKLLEKSKKSKKSRKKN
jgi:hypothetical protein